MKLYTILFKEGEGAPLFTEKQFRMACYYADMLNGKVIDFNTKKILVSYCKSKHFEKVRKSEEMIEKEA